MIQNPAAGPRKAEELERRIADALAARGVAHTFTRTREPGDAARLAREALGERCQRILVAGGDGTVLEVVSVVAGTDTALALLPTGTGNQLAANLEIPKRLDRALAVALDGAVRRIDVGMIDGHPFTCFAGAGFDAEVVSPGPLVKRRLGYLAYVYAAAAAALAPKRAELRVTVDGVETRVVGIGVEVANVAGISGPWLPHPIPVTPHSVADDGQLDVCVLAIESGIDLVLALLSFVLGRTESDRRFRYLRGREISIDSDPTLPVQADGERLGRTPFTATVRPRALSVVVPRVERSGTDG